MAYKAASLLSISPKGRGIARAAIWLRVRARLLKENFTSEQRLEPLQLSGIIVDL